jgi:signal transduction histidine kinase
MPSSFPLKAAPSPWPSLKSPTGLGLISLTKGRGVPEQLREAIFDRFKQVELDDAKVKGGSGLGLGYLQSNC